MSKNIRTQLNKVVGKSLNGYYSRIRPVIDELCFKEQYQGRIIDCMVGEVDDNYIETPETDAPVVKLEHSKEGVVKIPSIKGKTILVDADGNETDTPAEGCRLVSVGEEEDNKLIILSNNKNLLFGGFEKGNLDNTTSNEFNQVGYVRTKNFIQCNANEYLKLSTNSPYRVSQLFFYDKDKKFISRGSSLTPMNCKFVRATIAKIDGSEISDNDILIANSLTQLEVGTTITSYTEPEQHKTEILLNEPLRSLPNGVCDEIIGNKLIRRVGKMNFSDLSKFGRIDAIVWGNGNSHGAYQWIDVLSGVNKLNYKHSSNKNTPNIVTELYPYNNAWHGGNNNGSPVGLPDIFFGISNDGHARLMVSKTLINPEEPSAVTYTQMRNWVENNLDLDVEFIYEFKEPIIEELPNSITLQGFNDTTMYIENSITPTVQYGYNALIPYKQELSNQKEEVETNTLDIENNIIPYLMDMEYNLMLMEDN